MFRLFLGGETQVGETQMDGNQEAASRVTRDELERQWPGPRLTTYPDPVVSALGLPPVASRVLRELGLPDGVPVLFTAASPSRAPGALPPEAAGAVLVGRVWNDEHALLVVPDERVLAWHESGELTAVNTDLERYLRFLVCVDAVQERMDAVDSGLVSRGAYEALVAEQRETMRRADPQALADGWWWPGVVDELLMI
ncbi:SUKH-4 family immunity protein [Cellulomonas cellasea]|uniref:SUKH-4 immunity protein of toxin-antitoxin system n=2 Tax=Cellulomonas cellasea TaxID=43670 RepID=A0A0A0B550_9CELL|nr:SUKH-4 family immunity protein [Cellulomonas cellasea]KGM01307.1 hypothetical protein Q760_02130 [Cellulomonas cellasea DSM 20118]